VKNKRGKTGSEQKIEPGITCRAYLVLRWIFIDPCSAGTFTFARNCRVLFHLLDRHCQTSFHADVLNHEEKT